MAHRHRRVSEAVVSHQRRTDHPTVCRIPPHRDPPTVSVDGELSSTDGRNGRMSVEELDLAGKTIRKRHVIRVQTSYVGGACLPPAAIARLRDTEGLGVRNKPNAGI